MIVDMCRYDFSSQTFCSIPCLFSAFAPLGITLFQSYTARSHHDATTCQHVAESTQAQRTTVMLSCHMTHINHAHTHDPNDNLLLLLLKYISDLITAIPHHTRSIFIVYTDCIELLMIANTHVLISLYI